MQKAGDKVPSEVHEYSLPETTLGSQFPIAEALKWAILYEVQVADFLVQSSKSERSSSERSLPQHV